MAPSTPRSQNPKWKKRGKAHPCSSAGAITIVGRDGQLGLLTLAHLSHTLIPALQDDQLNMLGNYNQVYRGFFACASDIKRQCSRE